MPIEITDIQECVLQAAADRRPLVVRGGGSKAFYGHAPRGDVIEIGALSGLVEYEPGELVVTARAGTSLAKLEAVLASQNQMLAFEPPRFGGRGTLGGCVAAGLSGPRCAWVGAVRDYVLGVRMIDGSGRELRFGGRVIKNVAGYDVSRLMVGALGTLGILLEISLRVAPRPAAERTLRFEMNEAAAATAANRWTGEGLPLSASCYRQGHLSVRLSGAEAAVRKASARLGGEEVVEGAAFWDAIRDHDLDFFRSAGQLWRIALPSLAAPMHNESPQLVEWQGGLRWLSGEADEQQLRAGAGAAGGHVTWFRHPGADHGVFHPLPAPLRALHRRLKRQFDPHDVLNRGRFHEFSE